MKFEVDQHVEAINAIERGKRIRKISTFVIILFVIGFFVLSRPDIPKSISGRIVDGVKNLTPRIVHKEAEVEEEPVIEEAAEEAIEELVEIPKPKPGTVLETGSATEFRGKTVILTYVNSKETYCSLRVNGEGILITNGTERTISGIRIKVLEPSTTPRETCRVEMR